MWRCFRKSKQITTWKRCVRLGWHCRGPQSYIVTLYGVYQIKVIECSDQNHAKFFGKSQHLLFKWCSNLYSNLSPNGTFAPLSVNLLNIKMLHIYPQVRSNHWSKVPIGHPIAKQQHGPWPELPWSFSSVLVTRATSRWIDAQPRLTVFAAKGRQVLSIWMEHNCKTQRNGLENCTWWFFSFQCQISNYTFNWKLIYGQFQDTELCKWVDIENTK